VVNDIDLFSPDPDDVDSVVLGTTQPRPQIVRVDVTETPRGSQSIGFLPYLDALVPVLANGQGQWPSVTRLCQEMGIDGEAQRKAILRKHWSKGWTSVMEVQVPGDRQRRPHFFIHEKRLPMWLANIDTTRLSDPEVRANVERTQVEFADVLAEWVANGEVQPAEPKPNLPDLSDPLLALQRAVTLALAERERAEVAESNVRALAPAATAWETFRATGATLSVGAAAKYLVQRHGVDTGRNKLYSLLRSWEWVFKRTCEPKGDAVKAGFVEVEAGSTFTVKGTEEKRNGAAKTRLTADGLERVAEHFGVTVDPQIIAQYLDQQESAA
jgi:hypothetical protein